MDSQANERRARPRPTRRVALLVAALLVAPLLGAGCSGQGQLERAMEQLLLSFSERDYKKFRAVTAERLPRAFPEARFKELAEALHSLGKLGERHCERAGARAGGGYIGHFALHFDAGAVSLKLTLVDERVTSFAFSGPELARALRLERQGLLIDRVAIADVKGRPAQLFAPGQTILVTTRVAGASRDKHDRVDLRLELRVFRGRAAVSVNRHFAARKARVREGPIRLRGVLRAGTPGLYRLALTAYDQQNRRHARGAVTFRVRAPKGKPAQAKPPQVKPPQGKPPQGKPQVKPPQGKQPVKPPQGKPQVEPSKGKPTRPNAKSKQS